MKFLVTLFLLVSACSLQSEPNYQPSDEPQAGDSAPMAVAGQASPMPVAGQGGSMSVPPQVQAGNLAIAGTTATPPIAGMGGVGGSIQEPTGGVYAPPVAGNPAPMAGSGGSEEIPQAGSGGSSPVVLVCPEGYQLTNGMCQDINECQGANPCQALDCINEPGSYSCALPNATWRNIEIQTAEVSPLQIVQSQKVTCRVTVHNNGAEDYTAPKLIITMREPGEANFGGKGDDFLILTNVKIPANSGITYSPTYEFGTDRPTGTWRCYGTHQDNAEGWHDGVSTNVQVQELTLQPTLSPLSNPAGWQSAGPGETIQSLLTFTNPHGFAVSFLGKSAGRRPGATHISGPFDDMPQQVSTVLQPGGSVSQMVSVNISTTTPQGRWEFYPTWQDQYGIWHDGASKYFEVRPTSDTDWGTFDPNETLPPGFTGYVPGVSDPSQAFIFVTWACYYPRYKDASDPSGIHAHCEDFTWQSYKGGLPNISCQANGTLLQHSCPENQMTFGYYQGKQSGVNPFVSSIEYAEVEYTWSVLDAYYRTNPAYLRRNTGWVGR